MNNITHSFGIVELTDKQLDALAPHRLLGLYRTVRHNHHYLDDEWWKYLARIKAVLETKPHVKKRTEKKIKFRNGHKQKFVSKSFNR